MSLIPPVHRARSFIVPLEHNVLTDLEKLEDTGFYGSRINSVARTLFHRWVHDNKNIFEVMYDLSLENAIKLGYSANFSSRTKEIVAPYGNVVVTITGLARYLVESLPLIKPNEDETSADFLTNHFYKKAPEEIIASGLGIILPKCMNDARRKGALDGDFEALH